MVVNNVVKMAAALAPAALFAINALVAIATAQMMEYDLVLSHTSIAAARQLLNVPPATAAAATAASEIAFFVSGDTLCSGVK